MTEPALLPPQLIELLAEIRTQLRAVGLPMWAIAEQLKVSTSYVSLMMSGRRPITPELLDIIRKHAKADHVRRLEMGLFEHALGKLENTLGESAIPYVPAYSAATGKGARVRLLSADENSTPPPDIVIPLYTTTVHAGTGAPIYGEDVRDFNVTQHYKGTAVYMISGDSMERAHIEDGDRVVVKLGHAFKHKDIILCRYNGELMVKGAAVVAGRIWLVPANPRYHPWEVKDTDEFQCIGTVIEVFTNTHKEWWNEVDIGT